MNKNINQSLNREIKNTTYTIENKYSFTYSLSNDGSSNLQSDPSNITTLNVSPRILDFQFLVRNKTLNGNFDTVLPDINIGDILEFKVILTNLTTNISLNPSFISSFPSSNVFQFIEASKPTIGSINANSSYFQWYNITFTAGQSISAIITFKTLSSMAIRLLGTITFSYTNNETNMYSLINMKICPENSFSLIYSKNSDGSSSVSPNLSNKNLLNVSPTVLKVDLLARNKTFNENFASVVPLIGKENLLELKIILTNVSEQSTPNNISASVEISKSILEFLDSSNTVGQKPTFDSINDILGNLNWTGINSLAPGESIFAICTFKFIGEVSSKFLIKTNFLLDSVKRYVYSSPVSIQSVFQNNFSFTYFKTTNGTSILGPFSSNNVPLNLFANLLKVELLVRNKTLNETFNTTPLNISMNSLIEFKIILTNISTTETLTNLSTFFEISKDVFQYIESSSTGGSSPTFNDINNTIGTLSWTNIQTLTPGQSIYALATFKVLKISSNMKFLGKTNFPLKNITRYIYSSPITVNTFIGNSYSFTYALSNDGSSNLQSTPSNNTFLNVSPRLLNLQLLVRNKTLNGAFDTTISNNVNIGDLIEFKVVLSNLTNTSLINNFLLKFQAVNIFEFIEASKPTVGSLYITNEVFRWNNFTVASEQILSTVATFKAVGGSNIRLLGQTYFSYNYNNINTVYIYSPFVNFKINQDNKFSLVYSKNSDGTSLIGPTNSSIISLNVLSPNNVLQVKLLVRNKTTNGDFNSYLNYINTGTLIEFKIILTNISNTAISNVSASIGTFKNIIEFTEAQTPTIGTTQFENINTTMGRLNWTGITSLAAGQSIYALSTFKAIGMSPLKILAKVNFPLENITRYICSSPITIRINTENKFSLMYSKVNDGSSNIGPNTSNTTFLNISSSWLRIDLLVRNKTLNGDFGTNLDSISPGNILELKIILTNMQDSTSISNLQPSIKILKTILEFLEASAPDGGIISFENISSKTGGITWNFNQTLTPWQSVSATCAFKVISGAKLQLNAKMNYSGRYFYSSFVNIKINQENKFSLIYSRFSDDSSSIGPTPSNDISLNVSPSVLKVELLARNKSLNQNFSSDIPGINKGSLIEFKFILTNVDTINSITHISTFVEIPRNILAFLESPTPTVGKTTFESINNSIIGKLNWTDISSLEPGQSISALATFNSISVAPLSLLAKTNGLVQDIKRYVYSSPTNIRINPENSFSLMYSTTKISPFNSQVVTSNLIMLDVYPSVLKIELLVKNKSLNGDFVAHMPIVDTESLIEFKIILTNVSTEYTLNNLYSYIEIPFNTFQFIEGMTTGGGNLNFNFSELSWTGIDPLTSWSSIYAIGTFKAINPTDNIKYTAKVRIPKQSTNAYLYSLPINMKIIIPPTIKKEQRIYSAGGEFMESSIDVITGEIIQYRLTVSNSSNQIFYNIKITDILDSNVTYIRDSITDGNGHLLPNSKFISPTGSGTISGKVEWTINVLDFANSNNSMTICFRVTVN